MSKPCTETTLAWNQKILQWQQSGKSIAQWSRENNFTYSQSLYWMTRVLGTKKLSNPKGFIELQDERIPDAGVIVVAENVRIHLATGFDASTFLRCLSILKGNAC